MAGTSALNSAPIGPDTTSLTDVSESMRSTPRTFLMACVARGILSSDAGEKTSSPARHLDADDGDAQPSEAARHVLEQPHVGIVGGQKDEQVLFVAKPRRADVAASAAMRSDSATTVRGQRVEKEMEAIHRQRR